MSWGTERESSRPCSSTGSDGNRKVSCHRIYPDLFVHTGEMVHRTVPKSLGPVYSFKLRQVYTINVSLHAQ
jgi:hypothetical protein